MHKFIYIATDESGALVRGVVFATSEDAARVEVKSRKLSAISVEASEKFRSVFHALWFALIARLQMVFGGFFARKMSANELSLVTKQLASLLDAGIPLVDALIAIAAQAERAFVKRVLVKLRKDVQGGSTFAAALSGAAGGFPLIYRAMISAGEQTGKLALVLGRLSLYIDNKNKLKQKVVAALIYPMVVAVVAFFIVIFLLSYVVPQVVQAFVDGRQELPFLTEAVILLSQVIINWGVYIFLALVGLGVICAHLLRRPDIRNAFDLWLLGAPLIGGVIRAYNTTRFASTLCIVVGSGVPILLALETASASLSNSAMRSSILDAISRVREGTTLAKALRVQNRFPPVLLQLIESGEATGRLPEMLDRAAQSESDELERKTVLFTSLLEPMLILVMGGLVMMIVLAILMPIINLNQLIR
jgi:general secretion pathway protein F